MSVTRIPHLFRPCRRHTDYGIFEGTHALSQMVRYIFLTVGSYHDHTHEIR